MSIVSVSYQELKNLVIKKLEQANVPTDHAEIVADVLVHADLRGVNSHGVLRTKHYVKRVKAGGLNPNPQIKFKMTGPVSGIVDGDDGFGHVIAKKAMQYAIRLAKENGIGFVGVFNSSHCGALSYFVSQAVQQNLIGIALTHTDKIVVPYGGAKSFLGTNPIAFGFAAKNNLPIILDMATSEGAFGKILQAKELGKQIPPSWALDEQGNPTTDPHQVASLVPFGGPKGYGLSLMIDILSGILTGSSFGPHLTQMYGDYDKMRKLGHLVIAINPSIFISEEYYFNSIDQMIDELHQVPPAPGFERVMVPGEPEYLKEKSHLQNGVPIAESVYQYLVSDS